MWPPFLHILWEESISVFRILNSAFTLVSGLAVSPPGQVKADRIRYLQPPATCSCAIPGTGPDDRHARRPNLP
jgi:hypothetical protein